MKKVILLILFTAMMNSLVYAKDITFKLNQSEYYFLVGQDATIQLETENTYGKPITGMLTHSIVQELNQAGMQYSSTNSNSQSFTVEDGKKVVNLGFGSSNAPITLRASFSFAYNIDTNRVVELNDVLIHFVQDESQKQKNSNKKEASSKKDNSQSQQQSLQQQMNQMFNQPQSPQQQLQNNQMPEDSSALKEAMQKQMEEQKKLNEEFAKTLSQNKDFEKQNNDLLQQGYNQTNANIDAMNNNTGNFEVNYQKDGETASLKGSMENGNLTNMQKTSAVTDEKIMHQLQNDTRFQKFDNQLRDKNFSQSDYEINKGENSTNVVVNYLNERNESASIRAAIENNKITEIKLEKKRNLWWIWLLAGLIVLALSFLIYNKYFRKKALTPALKSEKPLNYKKEALKLLEEAKALFKSQKEKDAYGKASEAIRLYYSYKLGIKKELTNFDLIKALKFNKINFDQAQKCLNLCGLVEFAKYTANKEDFNEITELAEDIIV